MPEEQRSDMVMSYIRVRMALGLLGMALPVLLVIGGLLDARRIEPSISDFYHTTSRDIFVGTLCAIGVFLISYRGYKWRPGEVIGDDLLATLAGVSAFGVALFPNESPSQQIATMTQKLVGIGVSPLFHYASALVFFSCLAAFCLVKFARTARPERRRVYRACGWLIVATLLVIAVASVLKIWGAGPARAVVVDNKLVFWAEAIGVWAFGVSWLAKAKADVVLARLTGQDVALDGESRS